MIKSLNKYFKSFMGRSRSEINALRNVTALISLDSLIDIYIPWSGSALKPSLIKLILNDILIHNRENIVECGSGISTLYIASLFKQYSLTKRKIYSIDHDREWIQTLESYLDRLDLSKYVQVIHAPLEEFENEFDEMKWYKTSTLNDYFDNIIIDQLIVDGPPAYKESIKYSRYPAGVYFKNNFGKNYSIFLDDLDRKGEQEITKKWSDILGIEFNFKYGDKSFVVGMKGEKFNI
ncbi:class I SAM-dependent methyltransferase [Balneolaceae bacterium YR4-1]|uniref:Class I SAM-dependent methyltransferase n=1 Tax=Halalkalibaculum roseum TaxID=2709311 RepID=A0A6M1SLR3_9BACT|nr:class I SAM-dependent methyltransferase [Halalkalibaculum roseum]NGP75939.1 class I SAM-dependent methyltransferase [Halalkalibaculum roseum]